MTQDNSRVGKGMPGCSWNGSLQEKLDGHPVWNVEGACCGFWSHCLQSWRPGDHLEGWRHQIGVSVPGAWKPSSAPEGRTRTRGLSLQEGTLEEAFAWNSLASKAAKPSFFPPGESRVGGFAVTGPSRRNRGLLSPVDPLGSGPAAPQGQTSSGGEPTLCWVRAAPNSDRSHSWYAFPTLTGCCEGKTARSA